MWVKGDLVKKLALLCSHIIPFLWEDICRGVFLLFSWPGYLTFWNILLAEGTVNDMIYSTRDSHYQEESHVWKEKDPGT